MSVLIRKEGILSTIQDLGRFGYREFGVNVGGPMDALSVRANNILLGNDENAAVIEMHFPADAIEFEKACLFAIGGADFRPLIDGNEIDSSRVYKASVGSVLSFRRRIRGQRAYLAVRDGFCIDKWLSSSSTNLRAHIGGFCGRRLMKGDRINIGTASEHDSKSIGKRLGTSLTPVVEPPAVIRVIAGPEFDDLTAVSQQTLFTNHFLISRDSDRMGYRLSGEVLYKLNECEMLSSGVTFGTVQLLPDGQMIVLMADHQTAGGYPRILTVASVDQPILAQLGAGDEITFKLIDVGQAEQLYLEREKNLAILRTGIQIAAKSFL